ncbi:hypothetical protein Lgee_0110 [Legionella geestiana]|uniref:Uncharacterized protein n=1 Tax=Legionella geestiana TaxID=45065 RepID=A0A0W0U927_9GAMM|nr:hypothetical protein [Legionella geestiana]KTD04500.1 hypothetical protein Lgee_0110 [Legionella geestiana]QBS12269.1 hypothetical protein E4T54_05640 [Legionella geestiana]STX52996.1 Uncharacterised protein [Legionella geestiana]
MSHAVFAGAQLLSEQQAIAAIRAELQAYIHNNGFFSRLGRAIRTFSFKPLFNHHLGAVEKALDALTPGTPPSSPLNLRKMLIELLREPAPESEGPKASRHQIFRPENNKDLSYAEFCDSICKIRRMYNPDGASFIERIWGFIERITFSASDAASSPFYYLNRENPPIYWHNETSPLLHIAVALNEPHERIARLVDSHLERATEEDLDTVAHALGHHAMGRSYRYKSSGKYFGSVHYDNSNAAECILERISASTLSANQKLHILKQALAKRLSYPDHCRSFNFRTQRLIAIFQRIDALIIEILNEIKGSEALDINALSETINHPRFFGYIAEGPLHDMGETLESLSTEAFCSLLNNWSILERSILGRLSLPKLVEVLHSYHGCNHYASSSSETVDPHALLLRHMQGNDEAVRFASAIMGYKTFTDSLDMTVVQNSDRLRAQRTVPLAGSAQNPSRLIGAPQKQRHQNADVCETSLPAPAHHEVQTPYQRGPQ